MKSLFVTGTDTGVGKTLATALLVLHFQARGLDCGFMKPFATGCLRQGGQLVAEDVEFLRAATGVRDPIALSCPVRLEPPLAPLAAAQASGIGTGEWREQCTAAFEGLRKRHEVVVVEGVGGLMVPLWETSGGDGYATCRDLVELWQLPAVLVARRTLGTLNHTLLSLAQVLRPPAGWCGLLFCDAQPVSPDDLAALTSPEWLAQRGVPVWGAVPYLPNLGLVELQQQAVALTVPHFNEFWPEAGWAER